MLLQNLTLLSNDTVVQVTNIGPPARSFPTPRQIPIKADEVPSAPTIVTPILPSAPLARAPQDSMQIIVSTGKPGSLASPMVYSGEPTATGLEAARRAAQEAAQRAQLEMSFLGPTDSGDTMASAAYAEAAALERDGA